MLKEAESSDAGGGGAPVDGVRPRANSIDQVKSATWNINRFPAKLAYKRARCYTEGSRKRCVSEVLSPESLLHSGPSGFAGQTSSSDEIKFSRTPPMHQQNPGATDSGFSTDGTSSPVIRPTPSINISHKQQAQQQRGAQFLNFLNLLTPQCGSGLNVGSLPTKPPEYLRCSNCDYVTTDSDLLMQHRISNCCYYNKKDSLAARQQATAKNFEEIISWQLSQMLTGASTSPSSSNPMLIQQPNRTKQPEYPEHLRRLMLPTSTASHLNSDLLKPSSLPSSIEMKKQPKRNKGEGYGLKKCRKAFGIDRKDLWCTQCRWKKACQRYSTTNTPPPPHLSTSFSNSEATASMTNQKVKVSLPTTLISPTPRLAQPQQQPQLDTMSSSGASDHSEDITSPSTPPGGCNASAVAALQLIAFPQPTPVYSTSDDDDTSTETNKFDDEAAEAEKMIEN